MSTLKIKDTGAGLLTLQNPSATVGKHKRSITIEITNIPKDVTDSAVLIAANGTAFLFPPSGKASYTQLYSALGIGQIIK